MYNIFVGSSNSLSGPVPLFVFIFWPQWHCCYKSIHSCREHFFEHVLKFIPMIGNNKSPGYFLVVCVIWGCKKLSHNITPKTIEWSDVSFDHIFGCFHRFFIAGRQENCHQLQRRKWRMNPPNTAQIVKARLLANVLPSESLLSLSSTLGILNLKILQENKNCPNPTCSQKRFYHFWISPSGRLSK